MDIKKYIGGDLLDGIEHAPSPFYYEGMEIGLPFNLRQAVKKLGKEIIPEVLGLYHLFYHEQLVYVGMSKNIRGRLLCHLKDRDMVFNNVLWFPADAINRDYTIADILRIEYKMIKRFKPVLNTMYVSCR